MYFFSFSRRQMPPSRPDQMTIEKTPSYFVTESVPERIYQMSNDTRLLIVVRDPVTRAVSHYTQVITKRPNVPSFERLAFSPNRSSSPNSSSVEINASWGALQIGLYARHLEPWLRYFPLDRMHFVSGEGLISDPATELDKVQDFLGLRRAVTRDQFFFSSAKKGFPCLRRKGPSVVGSPGRQRLHCLGKNKGRSHPSVDAGLIESLRRFFRPHNERFYRMTKIDFGWP